MLIDSIEQARALVEAAQDGGVELRGMLAHAGESYGARGSAGLPEAAERERAAAVLAAKQLRGARVASGQRQIDADCALREKSRRCDGGARWRVHVL